MKGFQIHIPQIDAAIIADDTIIETPLGDNSVCI